MTAGFSLQHAIKPAFIDRRYSGKMDRDAGLKEVISHSGPTDAGLVALARREQCVLLTDDQRLFTWIGVYPTLRIELIQNILV
jgi:hypothetical protein